MYVIVQIRYIQFDTIYCRSTTKLSLDTMMWCLKLILILSAIGSSVKFLDANIVKDSLRGSGIIKKDPYRELNNYLTRKTHSTKLEENIKLVRQLIAIESSNFKQFTWGFEQLAKAFAALVSSPQQVEDANSDQNHLCAASNLANLRMLLEAMKASYKAPTREPENQRRLNSLLIKLTAEVRSYCYKRLLEQWQNQGHLFLDNDGLGPLDELPADYLFKEQLKGKKPSIKFLDQLVSLLKENLPDQSADSIDEVFKNRLERPCLKLVTSKVAEQILAPFVDMTVIGMIVYDKVDLAYLDHRRHYIKPVTRFMMCKRLLSQTKRKAAKLERKLRKTMQQPERAS